MAVDDSETMLASRRSLKTIENKINNRNMTKPIALTLTDTHLHEGNIELVTDIWLQARDKCLELGIKRIHFLGDFFT